MAVTGPGGIDLEKRWKNSAAGPYNFERHAVATEAMEANHNLYGQVSSSAYRCKTD
jgi:hypothetical protein